MDRASLKQTNKNNQKQQQQQQQQNKVYLAVLNVLVACSVLVAL